MSRPRDELANALYAFRGHLDRAIESAGEACLLLDDDARARLTYHLKAYALRWVEQDLFDLRPRAREPMHEVLGRIRGG